MRRLNSAAAIWLAMTPSVLAAPPLTLHMAIERALATHPDVISAQSQADTAGIGIQEAQAQRLQFSADASALARHSQVGSVAAPDQTPVNGTLTLTVPLFTGFKLSQSVVAAERSRDALVAQRDALRAEVTLQVTRAFWTLRKAELIEEVQTNAIAQAERTLDLAKVGYQLGRQASNEVDHAEVTVLNAQGELLRDRSQTEEARIQLASLLGMAEPSLAIDAGAEPVMAALNLPLKRELATAIARRPQVVAAEERLASAEAALAAAGGDRWPQLAAITSYQYGNNPYDPTSGARSFSSATFAGTWDARLSASFNLFDGGRIGRAVARADQDRIQAQAALVKARREAQVQVDLAVARLQGAHDRLLLAERSAVIAAKTLTWMQTRYQQGYSPQVDVLTAQGGLFTARMQRVEALVDEQLAHAELARALGTL